MDQTRRDALRTTAVFGLAVAAGLISPVEARAAEGWNGPAFDTKNLGDTVRALGGGVPVTSPNLQINAPDIAENGAVVQVSVTSSLPNVQQIAILVEKNPNTLSANFTIPPGTEPHIMTRVKMAETSNVYALAKVDGTWLMASKEVKVTLGGCGG